MKLFSADFCVIMLFGAGLICNTDSKNIRVIDRSCDIKKIELPVEWRSQCVKDGKLRRDVDYTTRIACQRLLRNERILKERNCF